MPDVVDVVFVGEERPGSRASQRLAAMRELGFRTEFFRSHPKGETYEKPPSLAKRLRYRLRRPADDAGINLKLLARAGDGRPPAVLWIDYVLTLKPSTYRRLRAAWPETRFVWYSEDDMMRPRNGSVMLDASIGYFDLWVTTKSFNAQPGEMPARGAKRVLFVNNTFDEKIHSRPALSPEDLESFRADISFVGTFEGARARSIAAIGRAGMAVRIWGNGWPDAIDGPGVQVERRPVYGSDLAKVYAASSINLAFLRKINRDTQTCRTVEIPACGGFMLHERTEEAMTILAEGDEAAFFANDDELIAQCRSWLDRPEERRRVAEAGCARIRSGGFSHRDRLVEIFNELGIGR